MSGDKYEPERPPWGFIPLERHFDKIIDIRYEAIQDATELARKAMEKRLDGMNEFRDTLKDQAGKFVTRSEVIAAITCASVLVLGLAQILARVK